MTTALDGIAIELKDMQAREAAKDISLYRELLALLARGDELLPVQRGKLVKILDRLALTRDLLDGDIIAMQTAIAAEPFLANFEKVQPYLHAEENAATLEVNRLQNELNAAKIRRKKATSEATINNAQASEYRLFEFHNPRIFADPITAARAKAPAVTIQNATHAAAMDRRF